MSHSEERFHFYYQTGQTVEKGDVIRYNGFGIGKVAFILVPNSEEACEWGLDNGAIMLEFEHIRNAINMVALDDPADEEDLDFISRVDD